MNAQQLECKAPPYLGGGECNTKKLTKKDTNLLQVLKEVWKWRSWWLIRLY